MNNKTLLAVGGCAVLLLVCCVVSAVLVVVLDVPGQINNALGQQLEQTQGALQTEVPTIPAVTTQVAPPTQVPVGPTQAAPTKAPSGETGSPLDALTKAFRGWGGAKTFRMRMTTAAPTGVQEATIEVVTPDRFHMVSKQFEMIIIGNTTYLKVGNQWQKVTMPQSIDLSLADPKKFEAELGATTDAKLIGSEVLDGTPTLVYQYTTTLKGPPAQTYTSKVWIAVSDNLPRKIEAGNTTIIYYDFNANIVINPPVP